MITSKDFERRFEMKRKTFDVLASVGGLLVAAALVVAGALLLWGYNFANNSVHQQLAEQQIYFPTSAQLAGAKNPPPGGFSEITPAMVPYLAPYAGQQVLTGAQAETYANHFIADHLAQMPYGGVYSKVSAAAMAAPKNVALQQSVETIFKGTTLRGLLLNAYGFWQFGQIAFWAAIAAFSLAFLMFVLVGFGFWHSRRTPASVELLHSSTVKAA
jgi:hypothetical protein